MKKNRVLILFLISLSAGITFAQQLTPSVVSTSGGFYSNDAGMLSFTTGEMSAVETYTSPTAILTQGFQQAFDFGTYIHEHPSQHFSFAIQPNPTDGYFKLYTESISPTHVFVHIIDVLGRNMQSTEFYQDDQIHIQYFDLSSLPQGIYLIALTVHEQNSLHPADHYNHKIYIVR